MNQRTKYLSSIVLTLMLMIPMTTFAKDLKYEGGEVIINVTPLEPSQIEFPGTVSGGFIKSKSNIKLDRKGEDLIIFAKESLKGDGEVIIVRLEDGRSYPIRIKAVKDASKRDVIVRIEDDRGDIILSEEEEEPAYKEKSFPYAPANKVSGLMREMMLVAELGKKNVQGYRVSDKYRGKVVMDDGNMVATIDQIFLGSTFWGYVIKTENKLNISQKIDPATFRLDGTRAISADRWELAAKPLTAEQNLANQHVGKIYIVTKAKR